MTHIRLVQAEFPQLLSYTRFVALIPTVFAPLCAYLQSQQATATGIAFVDSTPIVVCHPIGKLFGDKGYLSKNLFDELFARGLYLVTGIRGNMKNKLMPLWDKLLLRKRSMIESLNNQLKNVFQIEHTRHRSVVNGFINILAALIAFVHYDSKPHINIHSAEITLLEKLA